MALRTTAEQVKTILGRNYDTRRSPPLDPYIRSANAVTDRLSSSARSKGTPLTETELSLIEMWLSGYFYTKMDPLYLAKTTDGAGGNFNRNTTVNDYLKAAMELDHTGLLMSVLNGQVAEVAWMGKTESERSSYDQRNGTG